MMKLAGVKSEEEFYKKYPTEESFMAKHGKALKKAQAGGGVLGLDLKGLNQQVSSYLQDSPYAPQAFPMPGFDAGILNQQVGDYMAKAPIGPEAFDYTSLSKKGLPSAEEAAPYIQSATEAIAGLTKIKGQKKALRKAKQDAALTGLMADASAIRPKKIERQYLRPEDMIQPLGVFSNPYGTGTEVLAQSGGKVKGQKRNPVTGRGQSQLIDSPPEDRIYRKDRMTPEQYRQWYEGASGRANLSASPIDAAAAFVATGGGSLLTPLVANPALMATGAIGIPGVVINEDARANERKREIMRQQATKTLRNDIQWLPPKGKYGLGGLITNPDGKEDAGSMIGSGIGSAAGNVFFGPVGGFIGGVAGGAIGGLIDQSDVKKKKYEDETDANIGQIQGNNILSQFYGKNSGSFEHGGTTMGGDLQVGRGRAKTLSYNPFQAGDGETIMFEGPSHNDGGMPISFGKNSVEVEGGEPAMTDSKGDLVILGDVKINKQMASMLGDPESKNRRMKHYVADLAKKEDKQNKTIASSTIKAADADTNTKFGTIMLASLKANIEGSNMKLKSLADRKDNAIALQTAVLDTAESMGVDPASLAEGKIKKAKYGALIPIAQSGTTVPKKLTYEEWLTKNNKKADRVSEYNYDIYSKKYDNESIYSRHITRAREETQKREKNSGYNKYLYNVWLNYRDQNRKDLVGFDTFVDNLHKSGPYKDWYYGDYLPSVKKKEKVEPPITSAPNDNGIATISDSSINDILGGSTRSSISESTKGKITVKGAGTRATPSRGTPKSHPVATTTDEVPIAPFILNLPYGEESPMGAGMEGVPLDIEPLPLPGQIPTRDKPSWFELGATAFNQVFPYLRPSDEEPLDPRNVMGEMYALANNQVEPVQAQRYNPQLRTPYDISLQDMINQNTSTYRGAQRLMGYNPAALSSLNAQKYGADQKVLAEQFRMNQQAKDQVYSGNIDAMNQAQLQNLQLLDQQMIRQETTKSTSKETAQNALNSISAKYLMNQLENRELKTRENLYNYRFGEDFVADNFNPLALFDTNSQSREPKALAPGRKDLFVIGDDGEPLRYSTVAEGKKKKSEQRNGGIVKAIKDL